MAINEFKFCETEYVFLFGLCVAIICCAGCLLMASAGIRKKKSSKPKADSDLGPNLEEFEKARSVWLYTSILWEAAYYWVFLNAILCTLLVNYLTVFTEADSNQFRMRICFYSIISLISSLCPFVIKMDKRAKGFKKAFKLIDDAIYSNDLNKCVDAKREGEEEIDKSTD